MKTVKFFKHILLSMLTASLMVPLGVSSEAASSDENLVKGLGYTVETGVDITHSYALFGNETDPALGKLTDGKKASSDAYADKEWNTFYRGLSRSIIFELPEEKAVTGFEISLLQNNSAGIQLSNYYDLYISENGTDWMLAYSYDSSDKTACTYTRRLKITAVSIGRFKAKYVKIKFRLEVNAYIDEIEVYGGETDGTEAAFVKYVDPYDYKNAYNSGVEGCKDMVLLYCGYKGKYDISFVQNTEEEMLYYCGYVSKNGEMLDTMFDSFMFSALGNAAPSGRTLNQGGDAPLMSDWQYYIDSIFDTEYNCGAIERALDSVKAATDKNDYTMKLIINMPYPNISADKPFGDIDGDGEDELCRSKEEQLAIYGWFMDAVITKMEERGYKNIELGGFYWEPENIITGLGEEEYGFIYRVSELVHERDVNFFWIPLLYANGMDKAYEMGFDCAMMQPNLSFLDYGEPEMLYGLDEAIRKYGLGIEMEIHWDAVNLSSADNAKRLNQFYSYLDGGYRLGYMTDASHSYYQNSNPGSFYVCAKSNSEKLRSVYDDVYAFIKHTYVPHIPTLTSKDFKTEVDEKLYGYINA
ncbi:MAG: DUF4855 domain-containing protein, partial [Eubacteriales bacterium]|nr:DUF4855 domain-containing protein [Eubacteriales bacterium]